MTSSTSKQSSLQITSGSPATSSRPRSNGPTHTVEGLYIKMEGLGLAVGLIMTSDGFMSLTWAEQSDPNFFSSLVDLHPVAPHRDTLAWFISSWFTLSWFTLSVFTLSWFTLSVFTLSILTSSWFTLSVFTLTVFTLSVFTSSWFTLSVFTLSVFTLSWFTLSVFT